MADLSALLTQARSFASQDPDIDTAAELQARIQAAVDGDSAAVADLGERFAGRLQFGTAGLRGRIEGGTNRMNRVVVMQAAWEGSALNNEFDRTNIKPKVKKG